MIRVMMTALAAATLSLASALAQEGTPAVQIDLVNGALIEFSEHGNPEGEPVLLLHGEWVAGLLRPLAMEPALQDFRLIVPHRRGFAGSSDADYPFTADMNAVDMLELLVSMDIRSAHIIGHSSGGRIAVVMAMESPETVRSLTLMEPALLLETVPEEGTEEYQKQLVENRENASYEETSSTRGVRFGLERRAGSAEALDDLMPGVVEQMYADAARRVRARSLATAIYRDRLNGLESSPELTQPILFMYGKDERRSSDISIEDIPIVALPIELVPIEGGDHWFPLFRSEDTATAIADFLKQH